MKHVLYERRDLIGILVIDRQEALNALNSAVIAELTECLDEIAATDVRCLIVTGAGEKSFVAGADLAEMTNLSPDQAKKFSDAGNGVMERLENFPVPVIAAINGYALGGGSEIALACDIRLAAKNAVFAFPEVSVGILPGYGGTQRLVRLIGAGKAKELVFTANRITADEALAVGLVNSVHEPAELLAAATKMAEKIAANAPHGVRGAKKIANACIGLPLEKSTRLDASPFAACFATADQKNAMSAFVEKRKPEPFTGK